MARPVAAERRSLLLDAALDVVVEQGLRGLTHRAVDRSTGLAEGTTSAYFRTRQALHLALAERVTRRLSDDVDGVVHEMAEHDPGSPEALAAVAGMFTRWLDESPLLLAKIELTLEAGRDPGIAEIVGAGRARVVDLVSEALGARDVACPASDAAVVVASFDGILLAALAQPREQRDAFVADAVRLTLGDRAG
jgi:AcrR family transcriptional regulator